MSAEAALTSSSAPAVSAPRLQAIDLLRGLTIGLMIMANNNGGAQAFGMFKHADWNGCTPTDLVFPTFLFLVGVSIVLSTTSRIGHGATRTSLLAHILRRSVILYLLGIVVNSYPHFALDTMRFYGVLPRIALCYLVVASLYLARPAWRSTLALMVTALISYWLLMRFVAVPGSGVPGRDVPLLDPDRNLAAWLDRRIFTAAHLYEGTRDPEGLLSTLPALATTWLGLLTGIWLRSGHTLLRKSAVTFLAGVICVLLGALWNVDFPINKKLWTSSYVLFAGGWSLLLLAGLMWLSDLQSSSRDAQVPSAWWRTALLVLGTNAISVYVWSELLASTLWWIPVRAGLKLQQWLEAPILSAIPNGALADLTYSSLYLLLCWLPAYLLYRRRIFIKV